MSSKIFCALLLGALLSCAPHAVTCDEKKGTKISKHPYSNFFSKTPALATFNSWSVKAAKNGGSVSFAEAYSRENMVVEMINKGVWPSHVYDEYQLFSAGLGNVDSARLLITYGLDPVINDMFSGNSFDSHLAYFAAKCDIESLDRMLALHTTDPNQALPDGTTPLIAASYSGCLGAVVALLVDGADTELTGQHGMNALMTASARGHVDIIRELIKRGANITARHKFASSTSLHMASELGKVGSIQALCELGIDTSALTVLGGNALHSAAQVDAKDSVAALVSEPCSINVNSLMNGDTTALYLASQHGHWRTTLALLKAGADDLFAMPVSTYQGNKDVISSNLNNDATPFLLNSQAGNGACAIHAASENGHVKVVKILLEYGSRNTTDLVNTMCNLGVTSLHLASQYNRLDVAKLLINRGAVVDAYAGVDGSTALYYAVGYGFLEMTSLLLRAGANSLAQRRGHNGFPLLYAAIMGRHECLQKILDNFSSASSRQEAVNRRDAVDGVSVLEGVLAALQLHRSASDNLLLNLAALVNAGAVVNTKSTVAHGLQTPLHMAARSGILKAVRIILKSAAVSTISLSEFINQPSGVDGCSALHYACSAAVSTRVESNDPSKLVEEVKLVKYLLSAGADVNSRIVANSDQSSSTAVHKDSGVSSKMLGATPLYIAAASSSPVAAGLASVLMTAGGDPNIALDDSVGGYTPLIGAIDHNNPHVVEVLLLGPQTSLASSTGRDVTCLLADPNKGSSLTRSSSQSPLLMAVVKSQALVVTLLLQAGAECSVAVATATDQKPLSLIGFARVRRDYDVLQALTAYRRCIEADEVQQEGTESPERTNNQGISSQDEL